MDISQTAKLLYALLLDRTTLSQRNGWQDDQGRTFIVYPIAEIADTLDKGQTAIKAALNELDAAAVKNGWHLEQISTRMSFLVDLVLITFPHAQVIVVSS